MRYRGRGVTAPEGFRNWYYDIEADSADARGFIRAEGWDESFEMEKWCEKHKQNGAALTLGKERSVFLTIQGLRRHESGHHSETVVLVLGQWLK